MRCPLFIAAQRNHHHALSSITYSDDDDKSSAPQSLADEFAVYARIKEQHYDMCRSNSSASVRSNDPSVQVCAEEDWADLEIGALLDLYESRLHLLRTEQGRLRFWSSVAKLMEARGFNVSYMRLIRVGWLT